MRKVITIASQSMQEKKKTHFKAEKKSMLSSVPKVNFCLFLRRIQGPHQRTGFAQRQFHT